MPDETELFAWVGEDEFKPGEVGLKQYASAMSAAVSVSRAKIDNPTWRAGFQAQVDRYGKPVRLVRYQLVEELLVLTPRPQGDAG